MSILGGAGHLPAMWSAENHSVRRGENVRKERAHCQVQSWARQYTTATKLTRDNGTIFLGQKHVDYCIMSIFFVANPLRHRGLVLACPEDVLRCRIIVVERLKHCRMPSSDSLRVVLYR